jgi:hypothetical protein
MLSVFTRVSEAVLRYRFLKPFPLLCEDAGSLLVLLLGLFSHSHLSLKVSVRLGGLTFRPLSTGPHFFFALRQISVPDLLV